jgi:UDP-N-acetylglucosamine 2-epimerase (non-hydrolysing)/GDP/UDP-N,N'-diacetylbacillosamine 2-epimerase (hydrolysing)
MGGDFATLEEIQIEFPIVQDKPIVLFTLHSITTSPELAVVQIQECLKAIKNLIEMEFQVIATYANADLGGEIINENLEQFAKQSLPNFHLRKSLGRYMYHGILALGLNKNWRVVCLGNSSSGIKETPALKCPTVNIGSRQKGRLRGGNVIDSVCESESIIDAVVNRALSEEFRETCDLVSNPYFCGGAGKQIAEIISRIPLDEKLLVKKMEI